MKTHYPYYVPVKIVGGQMVRFNDKKYYSYWDCDEVVKDYDKKFNLFADVPTVAILEYTEPYVSRIDAIYNMNVNNMIILDSRPRNRKYKRPSEKKKANNK